MVLKHRNESVSLLMHPQTPISPVGGPVGQAVAPAFFMTEMSKSMFCLKQPVALANDFGIVARTASNASHPGICRLFRDRARREDNGDGTHIRDAVIIENPITILVMPDWNRIRCLDTGSHCLYSRCARPYSIPIWGEPIVFEEGDSRIKCGDPGGCIDKVQQDRGWACIYRSPPTEANHQLGKLRGGPDDETGTAHILVL